MCVGGGGGGGGGKKRRGGQFNRMRRGKKRDKGLEVNNREEGMNPSLRQEMYASSQHWGANAGWLMGNMPAVTNQILATF